MKKVLTAFCLLSIGLSFGQKNTPLKPDNYNKVNSESIKEISVDIEAPSTNVISEEINENTVYNSAGVEVLPEFPGGNNQLSRYLSKSFMISDDMRSAELKGKIFASFIIEKDGSITNIKIIREIGYRTGEETQRVLKSMPKWNPALQNGKKVRCLYSIPLSIDVTKK